MRQLGTTGVQSDNLGTSVQSDNWGTTNVQSDRLGTTSVQSDRLRTTSVHSDNLGPRSVQYDNLDTNIFAESALALHPTRLFTASAEPKWRGSGGECTRVGWSLWAFHSPDLSTNICHRQQKEGASLAKPCFYTAGP